MLNYGFPTRIHHDRGKEFNSRLFAELHRLAGIESSNTTPYHAMGNGKAERFNRTLINMLKSIPESEKKNWKHHIPKLVFAYNSTVNSVTTYTPFYLVFGREPKLPIDCLLPIEGVQVNQKSHAAFVKDWKKSMKEAIQIASRQSQKSNEYNKKQYDKRIKEVELKVGDQVLLKNVKKVNEGETGKLKTFWEQCLYKVESKMKDLPVYTIKPMSSRGLSKTVHRNMLLRANDLPLDVFDDDKVLDSHPALKDTPRAQDLAQEVTISPNLMHPSLSESGSSSDEENVILAVGPHSRRGRDPVVLDNTDSEVESENGIEENGIEENGIAENGIEENGIEENGIAENGIAENELEENELEEIEEIEDVEEPVEHEVDDVFLENDELHESGEDEDPTLPYDEGMDVDDTLVDSEISLPGSSGCTGTSSQTSFHTATSGSFSSSDNDDNDDEVPVRPRRTRKPKAILTYDRLGHQTTVTPNITRYSIINVNKK